MEFVELLSLIRNRVADGLDLSSFSVTFRAKSPDTARVELKWGREADKVRNEDQVTLPVPPVGPLTRIVGVVAGVVPGETYELHDRLAEVRRVFGGAMTEPSPKFEIDQLRRGFKRHEELVEKLRVENASLRTECERLERLTKRDPNAAVTSAIMLAERALDETIRLYEEVLTWEQALVDGQVTGIERDIALRGVAAARVTLGVLRGLRGEDR